MNESNIKRGRQNYVLDHNEVQELTRATHAMEEKGQAQVMANEVWKRLGKKYGFYWKTVGAPLFNVENPRVFSAIPKEGGDKPIPEINPQIMSFEDIISAIKEVDPNVPVKLKKDLVVEEVYKEITLGLETKYELDEEYIRKSFKDDKERLYFFYLGLKRISEGEGFEQGMKEDSDGDNEERS